MRAGITPRAGVLALLLQGCAVGGNTHLRELAASPRGVHIDIRLIDEAQFGAELLAVGGTALYLAGPDSVEVVAFRQIARGEAPNLKLRWTGRPTARVLQRLTLHSRFPQGMSDEIWQRLSAASQLRVTLRSATEQYRDYRQAVRDGYRRIGPAFPGMGEHWVNVPLLLRHELNPAHPTMLTYFTTLNGVRQLTGAGFAVALELGGTPPDYPAGSDAWHFHAGTIEDESFREGSEPRMTGMQLAVVHAWVWVDNPAGLFARDNWALPYLQARQTPPALPTPDAARGLSAAGAGSDFFRARWLVAGKDSATVRRLLTRHREDVQQLLGMATTGAQREEGLARLWVRLCEAAGDCPHAH